MKKNEFLELLENYLKNLSEEETEEAISYYTEIIDDSLEDGKKEEDIIIELEKPREIAKKIIDESNQKKSTKYKSKYGWTISMILLSPFTFTFIILWYSILLVIYSALFSFFLLAISFGLIAVVYTVDCIINLFYNLPWAIFELGASLFSIGLGLILIKVLKPTIQATTQLTKKSSIGIVKFLRGDRDEK